jgi:regulator of protease activity HflC (stomatin/prohibitin superfamily)
MVDSIIYWQITDPIKALYEVNDLVGGIIQLTITAMRNVIGDLDLDHALTSRDTINNKLRVVLDEATHKWGVKVTRVELRNINPPEDVRIVMEKQMTAERNRRARASGGSETSRRPSHAPRERRWHQLPGPRVKSRRQSCRLKARVGPLDGCGG